MRRAPILLLSAALAAGVAGPARGAPTGVRVVAVFDTDRCAAPECAPGDDPALRPNAVVRGPLQIHVAADSGIGLDWVRLDAKPPGEGWFCLQYWSVVGVKEFRSFFDWSTPRWPPQNRSWGCTDDVGPDHKHGEFTSNGAYELRVRARELTGEETISAETFALRLDNPPDPIAWEDGARASGAGVRLRWFASPEPDLVAYRIERTAKPTGSRSTILVPADPARAGCTVDASEDPIFVVQCEDAGFANDGTYEYTIVALRPRGTGGACSATDVRGCLASARSEPRRARVTGVASKGTTGGRGDVAPSMAVARPDSSAEASAVAGGPRPRTREQGITLLPQQGTGVATGTRTRSDDAPVPLAVSLAAVAAAAHAWHLVGRRARRRRSFAPPA